jgi:hypothetical protein
MEANALTLARGYVAVSFDCEGHGGNPRPMSGDVTHIEGTTQKLMAVIPWDTGDVVLRKVVDHCVRAPNPKDVTPPYGPRSCCHQVASW